MSVWNAQADRTADINADRRAKRLRQAVAQQLRAAEWKVENALFTPGHFEHELDRVGGVQVAAFNAAVTDHTLREHVLPLNDPEELLRLGSKVTEQHFYLIHRREQPDLPFRNLAVAKNAGTFFTPVDIGKFVASQVRHHGNRKILVDPCVGSGALLGAALICSPTYYERVIGVELDPWLARWSQMLLDRVSVLVGYKGNLSVITADGLAYLDALADERSDTKADIIINPPYGRVRITRDNLTNKETAFESNARVQKHLANAQTRMDAVRGTLRERYPHLTQSAGVLEWAKLFTSACAQLAQKGATCGLISPDSWMSGRDSSALRRQLIKDRLLHEIHLLPEDAKRFSTVNQAISLTIIGSTPKREFMLCSLKGTPKMIEFDQVQQTKDSTIPKFSGPLSSLARSLESGLSFSDVNWIKNARGELDQTLQSALFETRPTGIKLIRGEHIQQFGVSHDSTSAKPGFVRDADFASFMESKPKLADFQSVRIVGRQCSYAKQLRRLIFARIPAFTAVGNSCNYLVIGGEHAERKQRLFLVLGLLNSAVLDWFFRTRNSNNHVGNYEIDQLPFPTEERWLDLISWTAAQLEAGTLRYDRGWLQGILEAAVALSYGINSEEMRLIFDEIGDANERACEIATQLRTHFHASVPLVEEPFFNHTEPKLSKLDSEIISHVSEGGNWQDIPEHVPSQRLKQIREMTAERGVVRTTYYGRLRRDQPSYTINTYFNRPGNGTHIHPSRDRTLTAREAARLQSFPDQYIFCGNEGSVRKQIGNAVPPALAAAIGRKLAEDAAAATCVDAFCGAGGLSLGLEEAGWDVIAAIDNDRSALRTYAFNRPGHTTEVLPRDLTDRAQLDQVCNVIQERLDGRPLGLLAGGPPCQGFSHAGFRSPNDQRNDLAVAYLKMAELLMPRTFLLENVEGLLTYKGGLVLRELCSTLEGLGYRVASPVWKLCSEEYGVPQMRRRVFIVATTDPKVDLAPPAPTFQKCFGRWGERKRELPLSSLPMPRTVEEALAGLSMGNERSNDDQPMLRVAAE